MRKVRVKALLEMSEHGGYCSDSDCEYTSYRKEIIINIPPQYEEYEIGLISEIDQEFWRSLLPFPREEYEKYGDLHNWAQSNCCMNDPQAEERGLETHDYRYNILSLEIFDENGH